ncbi:MAG: hypothetical protein ACI30J_09000 [Paludibacteraceae bacterium]
MARRKSISDINEQRSRIAAAFYNSPTEANKKRYVRAYNAAERYNENIRNAIKSTRGYYFGDMTHGNEKFAKSSYLGQSGRTVYIGTEAQAKTKVNRATYMGLANG